MATHPVEASLELVAERCADLTPFVYDRLFAEYPQMKALFRRDTAASVQGEMLARVLEAILDFVGENRYGARMIQCEAMTHAGYDLPPQVFRTFFGVVAAGVREQLGKDWTDEFEQAWRNLLRDLDYFVMHPDQSETDRATAASV